MVSNSKKKKKESKNPTENYSMIKIKQFNIFKKDIMGY